MEKEQIERELAILNETHPEKWYHNFNLGHGINTIPGPPRPDNFLLRSDIVMNLLYLFLGVRSPEEVRARRLRLLDLGSAEGLQTIEAGLHGFEAVGVEGRQLFIDRAEMVRRVLAADNVTFVQGDVRRLSRDSLGAFDAVLCLGVLYHIDKESMIGFIRSLSELTGRILVIDTHVDNAHSVARYDLRERGDIAGRYFGRIHWEHPLGLSTAAKAARLRASLDNEQSFWLDEDSLFTLLEDHGFSYVVPVARPFHNMNADFRRTRILLVALKAPPVRPEPRSYTLIKAGA